jgi:hypothetical protein
MSNIWCRTEGVGVGPEVITLSARGTWSQEVIEAESFFFMSTMRADSFCRKIKKCTIQGIAIVAGSAVSRVRVSRRKRRWSVTELLSL